MGPAVASALMVDYTLTVAVPVSAGVANLASAFPALNAQPHLAVPADVVAGGRWRGHGSSGVEGFWF